MLERFPTIGGGIDRRRENEMLRSAREVERTGYERHAAMHDPGGEDPKQFHISEHPRMVAARAERLAAMLGLSQEERATVRMAIAWHDVVIEYEKADPNNVTATIRRYRGAREGDKPSGAAGNEAKSALLLQDAMKEANRLAGREVFNERQMQVATWAIEGTYPDVSNGSFREYPYFSQAIAHNPALEGLIAQLEQSGVSGPLFYQPHIEAALERGEEVPREVLIVALADLDGSGYGWAPEFFTEGDSEMRELYANLQDPSTLARVVAGATEVDGADRAKVKDACFAWLRSQAAFAAWQALRFEKIMYLLTEQDALSSGEEQAWRQQFSNFIPNALAAKARAEQLQARYDAAAASGGESLAMKDLLKEMRYPVPQTTASE